MNAEMVNVQEECLCALTMYLRKLHAPQQGVQVKTSQHPPQLVNLLVFKV